MQVHLTPEQEARLISIAQHEGTTVDSLLTHIALSLLDEDQQVSESIGRGIAQVDPGQFIPDDEMDHRISKLLRA